MSTHKPFTPLWWLRNPHMQTIWGPLFRWQRAPQTIHERLELQDGDFIDLHWLEGTGPIVIILHGLEGSVQSHYAKGMLWALKRFGFRAVFMHFRNCGDTPNRLDRSYHAGDTHDIEFLYQTVKARYPSTPIFAVGYSLGGNVLLKWLAEKKPAIKAACAVSVPFDLHGSLRAITHGFSKIYNKKLLRSLKKSQRRKSEKNNGVLRQVKTIYEFDDKITAPENNFKDAKDYYAKSSSIYFLNEIDTPTLIIHAKDDPFHPPSLRLEKHPLKNNIQLEQYSHGGHVGFISQGKKGAPAYFLETRIPQYFKSSL